MPPKKPAEPAPLSGQGDSENWVGAQNNQIRIGDLFLKWLPDADLKKQIGGRSWVQLPEEVACRQPLYSWLGTYLIDHYIIEKPYRNAGEHFRVKPALNVWNGLLNQVRQRFAGQASLSEESKVRAKPAPAIAATARACPRPIRPDLPSSRAP